MSRRSSCAKKRPSPQPWEPSWTAGGHQKVPRSSGPLDSPAVLLGVPGQFPNKGIPSWRKQRKIKALLEHTLGLVGKSLASAYAPRCFCWLSSWALMAVFCWGSLYVWSEAGLEGLCHPQGLQFQPAAVGALPKGFATKHNAQGFSSHPSPASSRPRGDGRSLSLMSMMASPMVSQRRAGKGDL